MTIRDAIGWIGLCRHPRDTVLATIEAVNARDWEHLRTLLADDFVYVDDTTRLEGPRDFLSALQGLVRDAPDLRIEVHSFEDAGHMVYMRGRITSQDYRFRTRSMWRAKIRHGRMTCLENFRVASSIRLSKYAARAEA